MKYSLGLLALAAGALADYPSYSNSSSVAAPVVYETITTTAITTYCPYATTVVHGGKTYTVTEATTLTITDCPCTVTQPVAYPAAPSTVQYTSCEESAASYPPVPVKSIAPVVQTYANPLHPVYATASTGGVVYPTSAPFVGAAASNKQFGGFAVAVAALVALAL